MFVLSWLAAQGVRNNLQPFLIFAGLCLPIFIAELRNHHNKWAIIVFDAVLVITYAFGYLVLRGSVLTGSMVLATGPNSSASNRARDLPWWLGAGAHEIGQRNRSPTVSDWKNERAAWPPTLMPRL